VTGPPHRKRGTRQGPPDVVQEDELCEPISLRNKFKDSTRPAHPARFKKSKNGRAGLW
jgi:hypothetical protein